MRSEAPALLPIFRSPNQAMLLSRLFLTRSEEQMTSLSADLGIPLPTLHREADRLELAGVLTSRRVGRTRLLSANAAHPAADPLTDLLAVTFGAREIVAEEFADVDADAVVIFGSWARRLRGERGHFPRDLDVLVVGPYSLRAVAYKGADAAQRRLGFEVNTAHRTLDQWERGREDALVADIRHRGYVPVLRRPDAEIEQLRNASPDSIRLREVLVGHQTAIRRALAEAGVCCAWLFGSLARGTAGPDSDIDIFVEFEARDPSEILNSTGGLMHALREITGVAVDVVDVAHGAHDVVAACRADAIPMDVILHTGMSRAVTVGTGPL